MGPLKNANNYLENKVSFWNEVMVHSVYDAFWQKRSILPHLTNVRPAILTVGGWFDAEDLYGPLNIYKTIEKNNPETQNQLVMGPWYHGGWARSKGEVLGDIHFSSNTGYFYQKNIEFRFFNHYLKADGSLDLPEAFVFETGSNQWRQYDQWPPQNVQKKRLYLHTSGYLSLMKPPEKEDSFSEYISDPAKPVPYINEIRNSTPIEFMVADQRFAATRPDVLVFESDILTEDLTIVGPLTSVLFVSTSGTDADWIVKLIDVFPDDAPDNNPNSKDVRMAGYQMMVRGEVMRSKFRHSYENPESMVSNEITKIEFTMPDINHTFLTGHKIMVQIQSSWFPLVDRNPQKFVDIYHADEGDFQKAVQRVYHSDKFPSHLKVNLLQKSD
jgi:putative CocE/NonD family hydrolase